VNLGGVFFLAAAVLCLISAAGMWLYAGQGAMALGLVAVGLLCTLGVRHK
jgi:hypothetical protein